MLDSRKSGLLAAVSLLAMGAGVPSSAPATGEPAAQVAKADRSAQKGTPAVTLERSRIEAAFRRGSGSGYFKGWKYPPKKPWGGSVKRHARAMAKQRRAAR